jgi:hypothetical protein
MKIRRYGRLILLVVFASLLSINALAQDEDEFKSPLELKLTAQTTAFCVGSPLKLELEVTNNGRQNIAFRELDLWREFFYSRATLNGGESSSKWPSDNAQGRLNLHPGESHRSTFELPLDSDFFQRAGKYRLRTVLYHVFSNDLEFELYDCGRPQEVKEQ